MGIVGIEEYKRSGKGYCKNCGHHKKHHTGCSFGTLERKAVEWCLDNCQKFVVERKNEN